MTARISTAMGTHWGSIVRAIDFIYALTAFGALGGLPLLLNVATKYARIGMTRFGLMHWLNREPTPSRGPIGFE